jgi:hypothetical protein
MNTVVTAWLGVVTRLHHVARFALQRPCFEATCEARERQPLRQCARQLTNMLTQTLRSLPWLTCDAQSRRLITLVIRTIVLSPTQTPSHAILLAASFSRARACQVHMWSLWNAGEEGGQQSRGRNRAAPVHRHDERRWVRIPRDACGRWWRRVRLVLSGASAAPLCRQGTSSKFIL